MNEANSIWALVHDDDGPIALRKKKEKKKKNVYMSVCICMYV